MTWNLWWHFGPWLQRQPLIIDTIREVRPDVLCLQEVWSDPHGDQLDDLAAALGMSAVRTDPTFYPDAETGQSFGNAILSRWPIERHASMALPRSDGTPGHRRIVAAIVDTPWGPWPFASTHFDHRFDDSIGRQAQARRLLELGAQWRGDPQAGLPLIVGADLNAVPDTDELRMLTGRSDGVAGIVFSDVWEQAGEADGGGLTWLRDNPYTADSAWPNRRLDYLLVSWPRNNPVGNPITAWTVGRAAPDGLWPSDHLAVVADFVTP